MLVDEVSMLDLPLAAALVSAISPRDFFQLVLVGEHLCQSATAGGAWACQMQAFMCFENIVASQPGLL